MWKKILNFYILCYSPHAAQFVTQKLRYKDDEFGSLDKILLKSGKTKFLAKKILGFIFKNNSIKSKLAFPQI